jgi:hypothetical protein
MTPLIHTTDTVIAELTRKNTHEITRWGQPIGAVALGAIVELTNDGRRVKRNWDLIDALKADARVIVGLDVGVPFYEVTVALK